MKTGIIIGGLLAVGLGCCLYAQTPTLDTSGLAPVGRESLSRNSTYWVVDPTTGITAPYPCIPEQITNAQFWALPRGGFLVTVAGASYALPANQMALLEYLISPPAQSFLTSQRFAAAESTLMAAGTVSLEADGESGAVPAIEYPPGALHLSLLSVSSNISLAIWGAQAGTMYEVQYSTNLSSGVWLSEGTLVGASSSFSLAALTPNSRGSLFLRVRSCDAGCGDTMPLSACAKINSELSSEGACSSTPANRGA